MTGPVFHNRSSANPSHCLTSNHSPMIHLILSGRKDLPWIPHQPNPIQHGLLPWELNVAPFGWNVFLMPGNNVKQHTVSSFYRGIRLALGAVDPASTVLDSFQAPERLEMGVLALSLTQKQDWKFFSCIYMFWYLYMILSCVIKWSLLLLSKSKGFFLKVLENVFYNKAIR